MNTIITFISNHDMAHTTHTHTHTHKLWEKPAHEQSATLRTTYHSKWESCICVKGPVSESAVALSI